MAYEKLNLKDGDVLNAAHLAHIEEGLKNIELTPGADAVGSVFHSTQTTGTDIGISHVFRYENIDTQGREIAIGDFIISADGCLHIVKGLYDDPRCAALSILNMAGKDGTSVTVESVSESTEDGGSNVVKFSDGKTMTVKNGKDGRTPEKGKDYFTEADKAELLDDIECGSVGETFLCEATGSYSHAEGYMTKASGGSSHAEGMRTVASRAYTHAEGFYTKASGNHQHVQGQYNLEDTADKYAHIVGNGISETERSNAHTLDWGGVPWFAGDRVMLRGTGMDDENAVALMPPLIVKIGEETPPGSGIYPADKTAAEIHEAFTAGRVVFAVDTLNYIYYLETCDGYRALFRLVIIDSGNGVMLGNSTVLIDTDGAAAIESSLGYCLPTVTAGDDGKIMKVVDGVWTMGLPESDSGGNVENGEDGFSPIAKVEQTATGAVISITDKDGTTTATITNGKDGKDGVDGQDGYTPQKGIDYFDGKDGSDGYIPVKGKDYFDGKDGKDGNPGTPGADGLTPHVGSNGNWFIGDNDTGIPATGPAGGQGLPGTPGEDGVDGYSPVRGKDYWTDADKLEIKSYVDEAILGGVW